MSNILRQLTELGVKGTQNTEKTEIRIPCPFHDDRSPSASVNLVTGQWICFRGCGSGSFSSLLERLKQESGGFAEGKPNYEGDARPILRSWRERGFTREMLMKWGIEWDESAGAMRIPVFNLEGEQVSNIWRAPEGITPKYRYESGFRRVNVLFGSWRLPRPWTKIVLVEGPLDAVWCQEAGAYAMAILGSALSRGQVEQLVAAKTLQVILCFDNDEAGQTAVDHAVPLLRAEGMYVYQAGLPPKFKDIQEVPLHKVADVIQSSHLRVNGSGVVHPRFGRWAGGKILPNRSTVWRNR